MPGHTLDEKARAAIRKDISAPIDSFRSGISRNIQKDKRKRLNRESKPGLTTPKNGGVIRPPKRKPLISPVVPINTPTPSNGGNGKGLAQTTVDRIRERQRLTDEAAGIG